MAEIKFTPGPWIVRGGGGTRFARVYKDDQGRRCTRFIGSTFGFSGLPDNEEPKYNARLIASAPELYAALESCLNLLQAFTSDEDAIAHAVTGQAKEALKKARGEQ